MSIIIGADFVPTDTNIDLFSKSDILQLLGTDIVSLMKNADYRIVNLELPFVAHDSPIDKCGPTLFAHQDSIAAYENASIDLVTLANNHIMDHGIEGLHSTLNLLNEARIQHVGAGNNIQEAAECFYFYDGNNKFGVYACTEHEFSFAEEELPGANPFDPLYSLDHICNCKKNCDFLIVLYHGGKEHYRYPSPRLQKVCRAIVDKGADLILCQHSHCIGCEEKYNNSTIVYGQGNFLFDSNSNECWNTGLLVEITNELKITYYPIKRYGNGVRLAKGSDATAIMDDFYSRSTSIMNKGFIAKEYDRFVSDMSSSITSTLLGHEPLSFRILNRLTRGRLRRYKFARKFPKKKLLELLNRIECEAWNELLIAFLKKTIVEVKRK